MRELTASCSSLCRIRRNVIAVLTTNVKDRFAVCPLNVKRLHNRKVTKSFFLNMALGSKEHAGISKTDYQSNPITSASLFPFPIVFIYYYKQYISATEFGWLSVGFGRIYTLVISILKFLFSI